MSTPTFCAAGFRGRPGIVMTPPVRTTTNSAPAERRTSLTGMMCPVGAPFRFASSAKEYLVWVVEGC